MTYLEKAVQIGLNEKERLIKEIIVRDMCPGNYFDEGPTFSLCRSGKTVENRCRECWNQECELEKEIHAERCICGHIVLSIDHYCSQCGRNLEECDEEK